MQAVRNSLPLMSGRFLLYDTEANKSSGNVPDNASITPDNASNTPDNASNTPDNASITPDNASITPDNTPCTKEATPFDPRERLLPGETNRVKLVSKSSEPVKVYNRFVKGMCGAVLLDLESESNGISWDRPSKIVVSIKHPTPCKPKTVTIDLCKLIATNREVFGDDWSQCPFDIAREHYSKRGNQYWTNAFKHCYWMASNASKDVCMANSALNAREQQSVVSLASKPFYSDYKSSVEKSKRCLFFDKF